ncbi:MAG TPA: hypothetical protein VKB50_13805 [Vicinamibacterales bacterium]|nr:hypothetical protein [Vicinamibacterales bacterium]
MAARILGSLLVGITLTVVVEAQRLTQVPASVATEAKGHPMAFAMLLADAAVPVGIEIAAADRRPPTRPEFERRTASAAIDTVLNTFNGAQRGYLAQPVNDVVVITPARGSSYLKRRLDLAPEDLVVSGAMAAIRKVFAPLDPELDRPGATLGSTFVDPAQSGRDRTITFTPGGTVLDALNEIAKQSGQGWFVATEERPGHTEPEITAVGLIHRGGASTQIPVTSAAR